MVRVAPGEAPPAPQKDVYWYDQEHDRQFFTFRDPPDHVPASRAAAEARATLGRRRVLLRPQF